MSIEDDVILLDRVPTIHLLGNAAIRMLAIGSEQQEFARGSVLFRAGDEADCGYIVQSGGFRVSFGDSARHDVTAGPGSLIGELALIAAITRPATATALEYSSVIRLSRTLFQRVLESDPDAALRLRDDLALRAGQATSDIVLVGSRLSN